MLGVDRYLSWLAITWDPWDREGENLQKQVNFFPGKRIIVVPGIVIVQARGLYVIL